MASYLNDIDLSSCESALSTILSRKNVAGKLIFGELAGSCSFNLSLPSSDRDYFGVYMAPLDEVLSLRGVAKPTVDYSGEPLDYLLHEVAFYCELVLKGNPKVIEPFYARHGDAELLFCAGEWRRQWHEQNDEQRDKLTGGAEKRRRSVVTDVVLAQYVSYARSQMSAEAKIDAADVKKRSKRLYHALRLFGEAERIAALDEPRVWLDGDEREFIMAVRQAQVPLDEAKKRANEIAERVHVLAENVNAAQLLPKRDNAIDVLDAWLVLLRLGSDSNLPCVDDDDNDDDSGAASSSSSSSPPHVAINSDDGERFAALQATCQWAAPPGDGVPLAVCATPASPLWLDNSDGHGEQQWLGIYAAPTRTVVSLRWHLTQSERSAHAKLMLKGGAQQHAIEWIEVADFLRCATSGNYRALETLLAPSVPATLPMRAYAADCWHAIETLGGQLLSQTTAMNLAGLAGAQLKGEAAPLKNARAWMLLGQAQNLIDARSLVDSSLLAERYAELRDADDDAAEGRRQCQALAKPMFGSIRKSSSLAKRPSQEAGDAMSQWLVALRRSTLK
jgi:RNA repair pathway DNA polymerase beta family